MTVVHASETAFGDLRDKVVVSPAYGRVVLRPPATVTTEGELVRSGDVVCEVESSDGPVAVAAPCDAFLLGVLVCDGDRVRPGRPLVHLREL